MRNKVLYISAFLVFFVLCSGYSQKSRLNLLPLSDVELKGYNKEVESIDSDRSTSRGTFSHDVNYVTPEISGNRKSSKKKDLRLCKVFGLVCNKEWSKGLIKLYRLPTTADIRIY